MITVSTTIALTDETRRSDSLDSVLAHLLASAPLGAPPVEHVTGFVEGERLRLVVFLRHGTRAPEDWVRDLVSRSVEGLGRDDLRIVTGAVF